MTEKTKAYEKRRAQEIKREVIGHYGGRCECCGEREMTFLTIDHIEGGGERHRQKVGWGTQFYRWLRKNEYPTGFRVMCHNCNFALRLGVCPHKITGE
jgi:hypothetical protein